MTLAGSEKRTSMRILLVGGMFAVLFSLVVLRAFQLQVLQRETLSSRAQRQVVKSYTAEAKRGVIYDARHRELAVSLEVTDIAVDPTRITDKKAAAKAISTCLEIPVADVAKKLDTTRTFVWLKRHASPKKVARLREADIPGVAFLPAFSRFYPSKYLAAQVLGFCGVDGRGLEGLEYYFNDVLSGPESSWTVLKDALGKSFRAVQPAPLEEAGNNLVLTLDRTIQYVAEDALAESVTSSNAKSGIAVVMSPDTGAVLALAHYPFMNPNSFGSYEPFNWRNRAVTDMYEPGSTMKVFMAAAALEAGITRDAVFFCENGNYRVGKNVVHDVHVYGDLALWEIVKYSSNIGAVKVGEMIGPKNLYDSLRAFGFGDRSGITCPGEAPGLLAAHEQWTSIDADTIAFGQGVSVTALQLASAISAIANGGTLMRPYLVQAVTDSRGKLVESFSPRPVGRAVSPATADLVRDMMKTVVEEGGTGTKAAVPGYAACGKTGTAQKVSESGGYARGKYVASFAGFVPADHPALTIVVLVDEPRGCHYGGTVAGPAFRKIAQKTLNYLNVLPDLGKGNWTASAKKADNA